jgi:predicted O-methyltransferase YrrM
MKEFHFAVSRETGSMLYVLARAIRARSIVEYGTSFGISTLHLAAALKDNAGRPTHRHRVRAIEGQAGARKLDCGRLI